MILAMSPLPTPDSPMMITLESTWETRIADSNTRVMEALRMTSLEPGSFSLCSWEISVPSCLVSTRLSSNSACSRFKVLKSLAFITTILMLPSSSLTGLPVTMSCLPSYWVCTRLTAVPCFSTSRVAERSNWPSATSSRMFLPMTSSAFSPAKASEAWFTLSTFPSASLIHSPSWDDSIITSSCSLSSL